MGSTRASGTNSLMAMTVEAAPARACSSSSVTGTYWSLATSYPLTNSPRATTAWSTGQYVCCRIRVPHVAWSRWKETPAETAAVYSLIGMATRPNEIVPEPIEWAGMSNPPIGNVYGILLESADAPTGPERAPQITRAPLLFVMRGCPARSRPGPSRAGAPDRAYRGRQASGGDGTGGRLRRRWAI